MIFWTRFFFSCSSKCSIPYYTVWLFTFASFLFYRFKKNQKATKMSNNSSQWIQFIYPPTPKPLSKTTKNMILYFIKKFKINSSSFFHLEFLTLNNINICIMCLFIELICFTPPLFQKFLFNSRGWITFI